MGNLHNIFLMKGRLGCPINHLSKKRTVLAVEWQMEQLLYQWGRGVIPAKDIEERRNYVNSPIFLCCKQISIFISIYMDTRTHASAHAHTHIHTGCTHVGICKFRIFGTWHIVRTAQKIYAYALFNI